MIKLLSAHNCKVSIDFYRREHRDFGDFGDAELRSWARELVWWSTAMDCAEVTFEGGAVAETASIALEILREVQDYTGEAIV